MFRQSPAGFEFVPFLEWGRHIGHLYEAADDLRNVLVPYFKAGLENNESCLWVTDAPFGVDQARSALRAAVGDFDIREKLKQIEIRDSAEWYASNQTLQPSELVADLLQREQDALRQGHQGLRTNGNCAWVQRAQWDDFRKYESLVQQSTRGRRMVCICSYCFRQTQGDELIDVAETHDFTIALSIGKP
jgi:hypothetical protein